MRGLFISLMMILVLNQIYCVSAILCRDPKCESCYTDQWKCNVCQSPFILKDGTCKTCSELFPFCTSCIDGRCRSCSQGYNLNQGSCCPENCKTRSCVNGDCESCNDGFKYQDKTCQKGECPEPNCNTCGKDGCFNCKEGFISVEKKCLPGSCSDYYPHCKRCDKIWASQNGCRECQEGYFLNQTVKDGYIDTTKQPFPCLSCAETYDPLCTKCSQQDCHQCKKGYFPQSNKCCPDDCALCRTSGCAACKNHFFYEDGICKAGSCSDTNCAQCGNKGCYTCYDGFILMNGVCKEGNCSSLYPGCSSCNVEGCTSCQPFFLFDDKSRKCKEIKSGVTSFVIPVWVGVIFFILCWVFICYIYLKCGGNGGRGRVERRYIVVEEVVY